MVTVSPKNQAAAGQGEWKNGLAKRGGGEVHESGKTSDDRWVTW